jgi:hypothetical protein
MMQAVDLLHSLKSAIFMLLVLKRGMMQAVDLLQSLKSAIYRLLVFEEGYDAGSGPAAVP